MAVPPKTNYVSGVIDGVNYIVTTAGFYVPQQRLAHIHMHSFQLESRIGVQPHGTWLELDNSRFGNQLMGYLSYADYIWNHRAGAVQNGKAYTYDFEDMIGFTLDPNNPNRRDFLHNVRLVVGPTFILNGAQVGELITIFPV